MATWRCDGQGRGSGRRWVVGLALGVLVSAAATNTPTPRQTSRDLDQFVLAGVRHRAMQAPPFWGEFVLQKYFNAPDKRTEDGELWPSRELLKLRFWQDATGWCETTRQIYPELWEASSLTGSDGQCYFMVDHYRKPRVTAARRLELDPDIQCNWFLDVMKGKPTACPSALLLSSGATLLGREQMGDEQCYLFEAETPPLRRRWYVSENRGYAVVKYQSERTERLDGRDSVVTVGWVVDSWVTLGEDFRVPRSTRWFQLTAEPHGPARWQWAMKFDAVDLRVMARENTSELMLRSALELHQAMTTPEDGLETVGGDVRHLLLYLASRTAPPEALWSARPGAVPPGINALGDSTSAGVRETRP